MNELMSEYKYTKLQILQNLVLLGSKFIMGIDKGWYVGAETH